MLKLIWLLLSRTCPVLQSLTQTEFLEKILPVSMTFSKLVSCSPFQPTNISHFFSLYIWASSNIEIIFLSKAWSHSWRNLSGKLWSPRCNNFQHPQPLCLMVAVLWFSNNWNCCPWIFHPLFCHFCHFPSCWDVRCWGLCSLIWAFKIIGVWFTHQCLKVWLMIPDQWNIWLRDGYMYKCFQCISCWPILL